MVYQFHKGVSHVEIYVSEEPRGHLKLKVGDNTQNNSPTFIC